MFVLRRISRSLVTVWLCVTFVFVILRLSGDPTTTILPIDAITPEVREFYRVHWGLSESLWKQYLLYFVNILQGDLGFSFRNGHDAVAIVLERLPSTLELVGISAVFTLLVGIAGGLAAALYRGTTWDTGIMFLSVLGFSVPNFFLAIVLILLFSVAFGWLPTSGNSSWQHYILPVTCLSMSWIGIFARFSRAALLEAKGEEFVMAARARGLAPNLVYRRHVFPHTAIPIITLSGLYLGGLITGSLVVENVFAWPGIGRLLVEAVGSRDLAVVQVIILLAAACMVATNLVVDLTYGWIDPRIRLQSGSE